MMTQGCDLAPSCAASKRSPSYLIHNHSEKIIDRNDLKDVLNCHRKYSPERISTF